MKQLKLITKLRGLIVLALALVFSGNAWADEEVAYTLTPTTSTSTASSTYAQACDFTIDDITWNVTGNTSYSPWRIGGTNFTNTDRTIYSKTAIADNITSVVVTNGSTSRMTVNSFTLTVASDADFNTIISTVTGTFSANGTTTFTRPTGADWTGRYFKFTYNLTATSTTRNGYAEFTSAVFNKDATPNAITSFTAPTSVKVGATTTATLVKATGYTGEITYSVTNNGAATVTQNGDVFTIVGVANGTVVIEAISAAQDGYTANTARVTITVTTSHIPSNYSTSWTTSNEIYLYNKATGLYLGSGGHWGTEGILKTTGLPFYMDTAAADKSSVTGVGMFSDSGKTTAHQVGYPSSANAFGIENQGIYIDAGTNYYTTTFSFYYNSDDNSYSIVSDDVKTGITISGTNDDGETVYLTPGSSQSLSWSTTPYYWSMTDDNQVWVKYGEDRPSSATGTAYYLYANGTTLSLTAYSSYAGTASVSGGKFMLGSYYLTGNSTTLTTTSGNTNASAVIYEQGDNSKFYLAQNGGTIVARQNVVTIHNYPTTAIPDEARWFVVTKADLIEDFENATATEASPKEATFLLANPDFSREVTQAWTFEQPTGTSYTSQTSSYGSNGYIRIGNALFNNSGANHTINDAYTSVEVAGTAIGSDTYGGNGNNYTLTETDAEYANLPEGTSTYYNIPYGGFYNCRILGNSGKVYQQVTITKAGYYRVSCDGYVYNPSGATGTATFYAKNTAVSEVGKQYVTTALPANDTFETMTAAGITFYANGGTSPYRTSILVYMPAGTMEIGVYLAGGTIGTVKNSNTNTFAEFDAMKIEYTGDSQFDIILNESLTSDNVTGSTKNYINAQVYNVTGKNSRTMYLKRTIKTDKWNSIVLPVNISNSAFNTAFGSDAILTKYKECDGNTIVFEKVDHSNEESTTPAMSAGTCYLIKPHTISAATEGTYTTDYANATGSISVTACTTDIKYTQDEADAANAESGAKEGDANYVTTNTVKIPAGPVFTFNQVTLTSEIDEDPDNSEVINNYTDDKSIYFQGTYFKSDGVVLPYSYALSDGAWYRYRPQDTSGNDVNTSMGSKGFRCWIGPMGSDNPAKMLLVIDDEEIEPTDIVGVTVKEPTTIDDNRVYSISGQLVGTTENTSRLPKGIYISNGKKFIVK